jgi:hypothetical protein
MLITLWDPNAALMHFDVALFAGLVAQQLHRD